MLSSIDFNAIYGKAHESVHNSMLFAFEQIDSKTDGLGLQDLQSEVTTHHPKVMKGKKKAPDNFVWNEQKEKKSIHVYKDWKNVKKTEEHYWKIRPYFWDGKTINMDNKGKKVRLLMYGLSCQSKWGDNNEEAPSAANIKAKYKWNAWNKQKGRPRTDTRKDFILLSEALFGVESDDPVL